MSMTIRLRRRTLLAYVLSLSSACLVLWVFLFISSDQTVSPFRNIELTAEDRVNVRPDQSPVKVGASLLIMKGDVKSPNVVDNTEKPMVIKPVAPGPALIPDNTELRNMSWAALSDLYHRYLSQNQIDCKDIARLGRVTDGGWDVCNDKGFAPVSPCVVYSFGVDDDFSFDDAVIKRYGCKVYSFDPSMKMSSQQRGTNSYFYKQGLADSDRTLPNGWVMSRFESIRASLKQMKTPISIVKMDIEEWEWEVLPDLLTSEHLKSVRQLLIELHQCDGCSKYNPEQQDKEPSRDRYIHMLGLLSDLYKQNFRIFYHHDNRACSYVSKFSMMERSGCSEIGFVRVS